jgi:hypothetical protein
MESHILDELQTLQTSSHVLWTDQQSSHFLTIIDSIFKELITEGVVVVYLDDILVFTKTLEEYRVIV